MINKIVFFVFLVAGLAGCKSKSAFSYSESIVKKERSLVPDIESTETKVERYISLDQYDSVAISGEYMESLLEKKIVEIDAMAVPKVAEADNFKKATMSYFRFMKNFYSGYKDLGNAKTEEDREVVLSDLRKLVEKKQAVMNDMQRTQKKFADANGFKIQK